MVASRLFTRPPYPLIGLVLFAAPAAADQPANWSLTLRGGYVNEYTLRTRTISDLRIPQRMAPTGSISLTLERRVNRYLGFEARTGWLMYRREKQYHDPYVPTPAPQFGRAGAQDEPYWESVELRGNFVPLGAGLRVTPWGNDARVQPYVDVSAVVYRVQWRERIEHQAGESFTRTVPGVIGSVGYRIRLGPRWGLDAAVELSKSRDLGVRHLGEYSSGPFDGLTQVGYVAGTTLMR